MTYLNVDDFQESEKMQGSEWIKIGVDTGAGKTAGPLSITYGTTIPGDSDLTFRTATGEHVKGGIRMHVVGCDDWGSNLRVRGVQAPVCKPLLSVGEYTTMGGVAVLYGDKGYMFHKGSNVAKKIDAWIQKELRDSQYRGCTVAYKENNVYNIYMKPRGNKIDAMPLSGDSESGGCRPRPNLGDRRIQIQEEQEERQIQKFQEEHTIQCETMWMVKRQWCRGCQIFLLNPVQDRSPDTS